ncbi:P2Y purinoceptor 8 [Sardina pilchardus]|uniref:P2Y purinoceptor 8 n=1 Tax=Sardina pilchardus TaxID=27697 RepID=UPI002E1347CF
MTLNSTNMPGLQPTTVSTTNSTNLLDDQTLALFKNTTVSNLISAIYLLITIVNLTSNGMALYLLLCRTSPKTPTIIFMINLTLTDLAVGCVLPFQIHYQLAGYNWTIGYVSCTIVTAVFYTNMYCSILTMTAISVDRYLGIVKPLLFREIREKTMYAVALCTFMWGVVLGILYPLLKADLLYPVNDLGITTCFDVIRMDLLPSIAHWAGFFGVMFLFFFLIPFVVTIFCYVSIICKLANDTHQNEQKGKVVRLAIIVMFVFVACFAPNNILMIVHAVSRLYYKRSLYMAYKLSLTLSCVNSCLDPFILYFACKEFRRKLRRMLRLPTLSSVDTHVGLKEDLYSMRSHPEDEVFSCNGETRILRIDSMLSDQ